jgi:hypothetical protein
MEEEEEEDEDDKDGATMFAPSSPVSITQFPPQASSLLALGTP